MGERNTNLWAPWRAEYIRTLSPDTADGPCFLCGYAQTPGEDNAHHVIRRTANCLVVMNRYPYTNGHLLVAPLAHLPRLEDFDDDVLLELCRLTRLATTILARVVQADGFNIGTNIGRCAGAGLPGHLHGHVVPRWTGDTNFMTTIGDARLIPEDHADLSIRLRAAAAELAPRGRA